jgi:hypothetical protein
MSASVSSPARQVDMSPWAAAERLEGWAGEMRVNVVRVAALIVFYAQHLLNFYVLKEGMTAEFHTAVTALVLCWSAEVVICHLCLTRRWVPAWLKYATTIWDLVMVTALVVLSRDPRSPLTLLYFLVIASVPPRLSLRLVYVATIGAAIGYLIALGYYVYVVIGIDRYYRTTYRESEQPLAILDYMIRIPRSTELIMLLSLATAGFLAGQAIRQMRRLVVGRAVTIEATPGTEG